jgi:hypothetical protein
MWLRVRPSFRSLARKVVSMMKPPNRIDSKTIFERGGAKRRV